MAAAMVLREARLLRRRWAGYDLPRRRWRRGPVLREQTHEAEGGQRLECRDLVGGPGPGENPGLAVRSQ
eukprot:3253685-Lingulodinium_polyedra.AAC.1